MDYFVILTFIVFIVGIWNTSIGPTGGVTFAAMATLLPPPAVIPLHAAVEAIAGINRALLLRQYANWRFVAAFCFCGLIGFGIGLQILDQNFLTNDALRVILGVAIIITAWVQVQKLLSQSALWTALGGTATAFMTLFIGATGPLVSALIQKRHSDHRRMLSTSTVCMVFQHTGKILIFGLLGFSFSQHAGLLASLVAASLAGNWVGRGLLLRLNERFTKPFFKLLLTILGSHLLWTGLT